MNASLGTLTAIVDDPSSTPELLAEVAEELRHRTTKGAKNLLARLGGDSAPATPPRSAGGSRTPSPRSGGTVVFPTETTAESEHSRDIEAQFAALRATFTAESEILARWGLTSSMPEDMALLVLEHWAARLSDEPDEFGRSRTTLSRDTARLAELGREGRAERRNTDGN